MNTFIQKFTNVINGFITVFDRIVFKGSFMPLMHEQGAMNFCAGKGILNKDFKDWMLVQTAGIVNRCLPFPVNASGSRVSVIFHFSSLEAQPTSP